MAVIYQSSRDEEGMQSKELHFYFLTALPQSNFCTELRRKGSQDLIKQTHRRCSDRTLEINHFT